jgi:hypothetical protein
VVSVCAGADERGAGMAQTGGEVGPNTARVGGREQSRHRGWMRIVVAAGPSIDAESPWADVDNTDRVRRKAEMHSLSR